MVCAALVCLTPVLSSEALAEGKRSETSRSLSESLGGQKNVIQPGGYGGPDTENWATGVFAYLTAEIHKSITIEAQNFVNEYSELIQSAHVPLFLTYCSLKIAI